jgi:TusA-related sulfurtransferase
MSSITKTNLSNVPWPLNLLQCSRETEAMKSGDELIITINDTAVKDNLVLLFKAMPAISYHVNQNACGYVIHVTKGGSNDSNTSQR